MNIRKQHNDLEHSGKLVLLEYAGREYSAADLAHTFKELAAQHKEIEQQAEDLLNANRELALQNIEKEKRTAELVAANLELANQNKEKEQRAKELENANIELTLQNELHEKLAAELIGAIRNLEVSEEQTREVNKELEAFSYSVSHDLRAPLRAVNGYAKMLRSHLAGNIDTEANRLLDNIAKNAKKMGQLIDDLLTFSRIGRRELVKKYISMERVVTEVCNELKNEQPDRDIIFRIGELPDVQADNVAIRQVWLNLVSNALKYTKYKATAMIEIGSGTSGDEIIYYIKDNGAGFDMRYAGKLFGVFQRLHSDEEFEGTGVGLALVQRIIVKHGGTVCAVGEVNNGATITFKLNKS